MSGSFGFGVHEALPDLRLRADDCGVNADTVTQQEWEWFQQLFLGRAAPQTAAVQARGKANQKRKAKALAGGQVETRRAAAEPKKKQRKTAHRYVRALDHLVVGVCGQGLERFKPVASPPPFLERPLLVLSMDEGSSGYAMAWFLAYHAKCRMVVVRDIYHRQWNDTRLAISSAGLWWAVLLTTVSINMAYGPWDGAAWWQKLKEGGAELMSQEKIGNPFFESFYQHFDELPVHMCSPCWPSSA